MPSRTHIFQSARSGKVRLLLGLVGSGVLLRLIETRARRTRRLAGSHRGQPAYVNDVFVRDMEGRQLAELDLARSRTELRQLAEHQANVKEDERKRIAREIHDELGQNLLALRIDLSMIAAVESSAALKSRIECAIDQVDLATKAVKMIINDLRPPVLDLGLHPAVEWEIAKFQRRTGIRCHLDIHGEEFNLDDQRATAMFRIVQESLTNIMRHSRADRVEVEIWRDNGWMFIRIHDNGIGMPAGCRRKANSFGLIGIAERVYALGGAFDTDSGPQQGTTITITVPLQVEPG